MQGKPNTGIGSPKMGQAPHGCSSPWWGRMWQKPVQGVEFPHKMAGLGAPCLSLQLWGSSPTSEVQVVEGFSPTMLNGWEGIGV